jgi:F-type H+-transporting ATPase subunit epsilon
MTLNLLVLSHNRVIWDSEVQEIILSTNSGQIGVLPNHASLVVAVDIGVMKICLNGQWSTMALMGGFTKIDNDRITILVNNAERDVDIDLKEARETFKVAKADLA